MSTRLRSRGLRLPVTLLLLLLSMIMAAPTAVRAEDQDELRDLVLKYESLELPSGLQASRPVHIVVEPFADVREDKKIAGRSATYSVFHIKGTHEQYDSPSGFLDFISESYAGDLRRLGFSPEPLSAAQAPTTTPADAVRWQSQNLSPQGVDSGLIVTGEIRRFYGEVVTNTWAWPFVGKTAKGEVKLTIRVLDSLTRQVLAEQEAEGASDVGGGPDKVNEELNKAFAKAMRSCWSPVVVDALKNRANEAVTRQEAAETAIRAKFERLLGLNPDQLLPVPVYQGLTVVDLKKAALEADWAAGVEAELQTWFGASGAPDDSCRRLARSCSYSFQESKLADGRVLLVTTVPEHITLEGFLSKLREESLPWLALRQPALGSFGASVTRLKDGQRMVAVAVAPVTPAAVAP